MRPFLARLVDEFAALIREEDAYIQGAEVYPTLTGLRVVVPGEGLRLLLGRSPLLAEARVLLDHDRVVLEVPRYMLRITGRFEVRGPSVVAYEVQRVEFAGLPVSQESVEGLLEGRVPALDFGPVLGELAIRQLVVKPEAVELTLGPGFLFR